RPQDEYRRQSSPLRVSNTAGMHSGISSEISPGPTVFAASPCSHAAIAAASNDETPCAIRPPMKPASTSPDPAVANAGGALLLMTARPSAAATTVSAPFSNTVHLASAAAARAASTLLFDDASNPGKRRSNSP